MKVTAKACKTPVKVLLKRSSQKFFHSPGPVSRDSLVMLTTPSEAFVYVLELFVRVLFSLETFLLRCS